MYLFYLGSDTLVKHSAEIIRNLKKQNAEVKIVTPVLDVEKAESTLKSVYPDLYQLKVNFISIVNMKPTAFICCNDWSPEVQILIIKMRKLGVPTIALQESVVDLSDSSQKYIYADLVFAQGKVSQSLIKNKSILTGNPRYSSYQVPKITSQNCLINCNFTYGIFENEALDWIKDVTSTLSELSIDYKISKHPRDTTDLREFDGKIIASGAETISEQITESKIVITRFSSLIHESLLLGRKVIYYNPFQEDMGYNFYPDNLVLAVCNTQSELEKSISNLYNCDYKDSEFKMYLKEHLYFSDICTSELIANKILSTEIQVTNKNSLRLSGTLYRYIKQLIKRGIFKVRRF